MPKKRKLPQKSSSNKTSVTVPLSKQSEEKNPAQVPSTNHSSTSSNRTILGFIGLMALSYLARSGNAMPLAPVIEPLGVLPSVTPEPEEAKTLEIAPVETLTYSDAFRLWERAFEMDDPSELTVSVYRFIEDLSGDHGYRINPLLECISADKPKILNWLIQTAKIDINGKDPEFGNTPLIISIREGSHRVFTVLMAAAGCDFNAVNNKGLSALHYAARSNDPFYMATLLQAGIDPNVLGADMTPLMVAARENKYDQVRLLVQTGANTALKNSKGKMAQDYALLRSKEDPIAVYLNSKTKNDVVLYGLLLLFGIPIALRLTYLLNGAITPLIYPRKPGHATQRFQRPIDIKDRAKVSQKEKVRKSKGVELILQAEASMRELSHLQKSANPEIAAQAKELHQNFCQLREQLEFAKLKLQESKSSQEEGCPFPREFELEKEIVLRKIRTEFEKYPNKISKLIEETYSLKQEALLCTEKVKQIAKEYHELSMSKLNQFDTIETLKKTCTLPDMQSYLLEIEEELQKNWEIVVECTTFGNGIGQKLEKNPYCIDTNKDKEYLIFCENVRVLKKYSSQLSTQLLLFQPIVHNKTKYQNLQNKLFGSVEKTTERKHFQTDLSEDATEYSIIGRLQEKIRVGRIAMRQSGSKGEEKIVAKAEKLLNELLKKSRQLHADMAIVPLEMTQAKIFDQAQSIAHLDSLVQSVEDSLGITTSSLPERKGRSGFFAGSREIRSRPGGKDRSLLDPAFKVVRPLDVKIAPFFAEQAEADNYEFNDKFPLVAQIAKQFQTDQSQKKKRSILSKEVTLDYYQYVGVIHSLAEKIFEIKIFPKHSADPGWKKIKSIYNNLTHNAGILADYSLVQVKEACAEFIQMVLDVEKNSFSPAAFNKPKSELLKKLMAKLEPTVRQPPFIESYIGSDAHELPKVKDDLSAKIGRNYLELILPKYQPNQMDLSLI